MGILHPKGKSGGRTKYYMILSWWSVGGVCRLVATTFGVVCVCNDPSAGSPTETLLRLLLPLNDKV